MGKKKGVADLCSLLDGRYWLLENDKRQQKKGVVV
jgi:hypothetical protein